VAAPYAGNGAAMRAAPVGWMFPRRETGMLRVAQDQARITHTDPRAVAGSVAIAGAVALALAARSGALKPDDMIDALARWVRPVDASFGADIETLRALRLRDPDDAVWSISRAGQRPSEAGIPGRWPHAEGMISPFVVPSVLWSLYSFLRSPDDYMEAIRIAIGGGGDADTTAAMTGAISGAYLGLDAIPRTLAERLHDDGSWGYDDLVRLVDAFRDVPP